MLIQGDGAPPDPVQGLAFLESAAAGSELQWQLAAARQLARYYKGPYSLPADPDKAAYWQGRAANLKLERELVLDQDQGYVSTLRTP